MKNALIIVGGSLASFVILLLIALALVRAKPEWFAGTPQKSHADITGLQVANNEPAGQGLCQDPVAIAGKRTQPDSSGSRPDSATTARIELKTRALELQIDSLKHQLQVRKVKLDSTRQMDWKATAKLLESMSADEASKILKQMKDTDVKQVLAKVKKKQAGKLLATLDPARAAKLLR